MIIILSPKMQQHFNKLWRSQKSEGNMAKHRIPSLLWAVFLPAFGMGIGLYYFWYVNRYPSNIVMLVLPILPAAVITYLGQILIPVRTGKMTRILVGVPASLIYFYVTWFVPFITNYPGYGGEIEYVGFEVIILLIITFPISLVHLGVNKPTLICLW